MKIAIPGELDPKEKRVAMVPANVKKLVDLGAEVMVESGAGRFCGFTDQDFQSAGATILSNHQEVIRAGDLILRLRKPPLEEVEWLRPGAIHISYLDPFNEPELIRALAQKGVSAICMELIPRTTRAQKMDALSSQANLAGYVSVILAADHLPQIFPMMTTPAGTIPPARVFIIGAGVAGLQAIATAKRLGAIVEAFDTRPVVEEQVRSLGGRFVTIDVGETGETEQGYARELTPEQLRLQQEGMARHCEKSDVVITTAQVFGRRAPRIVTADMISRMKPGSVVVDLAVETGGNVEGSVLDEIVEKNGVKIIGLGALPSRVAFDASQMYSNNLTNLVTDYWDGEQKAFRLDLDDEIIRACLVTHQGEIRDQRLVSTKETE